MRPLFDYRNGVSSPRNGLAVALLVMLVGMLACGACGTARPTLSGRLVNSMKRDPAEPVAGVLITVQEAEVFQPDGEKRRYGQPERVDIIKARPEILASTVSGPDGAFSLPGERQGIGLNIMPVRFFQFRFHRDDFKDAVFNYFYDRGASFVFLDEERLGPVPLRPNWADAPSTQPARPVDIITR